MSKQNIGQKMLISGMMLMVILGIAVSRSWVESRISAPLFVIALLLELAGIYLSRRGS